MDSATLMQQLKDTQAGTPDAATLYNTAVNKYGIPEIRNTVAGLRTTLANTSSAINNVAPSVAARSQGSLVTGGQQARLANLERAPLDTALATENTALGNASSDLNSKLSEATNEANLGYKSGQDKLTNLKDLLTVAQNRETQAAAKADADRKFAAAQTQQAWDNAHASGGSGSGGKSGGSKGSSMSPGQRVADLFDGYNPSTDKWYTENVVRPTMMKEYGLNEQQANNLIYPYRKKTFGE